MGGGMCCVDVAFTGGGWRWSHAHEAREIVRCFLRRARHVRCVMVLMVARLDVARTD